LVAERRNADGTSRVSETLKSLLDEIPNGAQSPLQGIVERESLGGGREGDNFPSPPRSLPPPVKFRYKSLLPVRV